MGESDDSHPSSFLPITPLFWITVILSQSCISSLVLSTPDICGDLPPEVDGTVCPGDTILNNKRQKRAGEDVEHAKQQDHLPMDGGLQN
jgi:hypothetical protein